MTRISKAPLPVHVRVVELPLPPCTNDAKLKRELALVPKSLREDAIGEAWVAHGEGRDPISAVLTFRSREYRYADRHVQIETSEDGEPYAIDSDGTRNALPAKPMQSNSSVGTRRRNSLAKAG